ncbi:MAG TPA: FkbM family methyltransferase [Solirubrobacteraceae bacterium]|nr:FkbM family methyltransferase [Solirubrobacteraceae bacterium]
MSQWILVGTLTNDLVGPIFYRRDGAIDGIEGGGSKRRGRALVTVTTSTTPRVPVASGQPMSPRAVKDPLRRAIDRFGPLRALVKSDAGQRAVEALRGARAVHEPVRFLAAQFGRPRPARYRLRRSRQIVHVRHRTADIEVLNEIFGGTGGRAAYEPPAGLTGALDHNPSPRILDLGGNVGLFGLYALHRWPGASVHSFEPDVESASLLRAAIAENRLENRWTLTPAAVANHSGTMKFRPGLSSESHLLDVEAGSHATPAAEGVVEVPVEDLFALAGRLDLVKMDIEGGEWSLLADPRMARLDADLIVLEWHAQGCPAPDPRAHVICLLRDAGYGELYEPIEPSHCGMLWARRSAALAPAPAAG